jgi:IS5 family transposase
VSLGAALSGSQKKRNRRYSAIRARVEHLFRIVKRQFGYTKVRYLGLAKNTAQVMVLIGLANLYTLRRRLVTQSPRKSATLAQEPPNCRSISGP